jgi:hypothetical protein
MVIFRLIIGTSENDDYERQMCVFKFIGTGLKKKISLGVHEESTVNRPQTTAKQKYVLVNYLGGIQLAFFGMAVSRQSTFPVAYFLYIRGLWK